jgi:hypothetical protein
MGAPSTPGQKLYLRGDCPDEQLKEGPLPVTATVEGVTLPPTVIHQENAFELSFPLPDSLVGKPEMRVEWGGSSARPAIQGIGPGLRRVSVR